jgi:hypothetical protein
MMWKVKAQKRAITRIRATISGSTRTGIGASGSQ